MLSRFGGTVAVTPRGSTGNPPGCNRPPPRGCPTARPTPGWKGSGFRGIHTAYTAYFGPSPAPDSHCFQHWAASADMRRPEGHPIRRRPENRQPAHPRQCGRALPVWASILSRAALPRRGGRILQRLVVLKDPSELVLSVTIPYVLDEGKLNHSISIHLPQLSLPPARSCGHKRHLWASKRA